MAEQRVNAAGQVVEYDKDSQRWVPVKESEPDTAPVVENNDPAPSEDGTLASEGETTPRRSRKYSN